MGDIYKNDFSGKVAVVSGGAQGIGKSVVEELLSHGAHVVSLDIKHCTVYTDCKMEASFSGSGVKTLDMCDASEGVVPLRPQQEASRETKLKLDICNRDHVEHTLDWIERYVGPIEYLVHVAAILTVGKICDLQLSDWSQSFRVNTEGAFNLCSGVARYMCTRQGGSIVAVGSNAATTPRKSMGAYAASKSAMTMMMKCLALELADYNIRCNVVAPGSTDTQMQRQLWVDETSADRIINGNLQEYRLGIPLKKIAQPIEVAQSILFLLSSLASHITMEELKVDGGATLG